MHCGFCLDCRARKLHHRVWLAWNFSGEFELQCRLTDWCKSFLGIPARPPLRYLALIGLCNLARKFPWERDLPGNAGDGPLVRGKAQLRGTA